jgi:HIRAN domain
MKDTFDTYVAGVTYKNPNGVSIQSILKEYVKENYDTNRFDKDDYDYWTNKEIEEFEFEVYQYELYETGTISLVPEPDNPYDSNAIMVIHDDIGMIGYIPRDDNTNLAIFLRNNFDDISVDMELRSGPYKYYDLETDKVKKKNNPYHIRLYIKSFIKDIEIPSDNQIVNTTESKNTESKNNEEISVNNYNYDIFELLALTHLNKESTDTTNRNPISKKETIKQTIGNDISEEKYKSPLLYLAAATISIILAIILIITDHYILILIPMILAVSFTMLYFEIKDRKDTQA